MDVFVINFQQVYEKTEEVNEKINSDKSFARIQLLLCAVFIYFARGFVKLVHHSNGFFLRINQPWSSHKEQKTSSNT